MNRSNCNVGKQIMILQQQINHKKKMQNINHKSSSNLRFSHNSANQYSYLHKQYGKAHYYENQQHIKNIRRLQQLLTKQKSMSDRLKDSEDFFAYPVYFFRYEQEKKISRKKKPVKQSGLKKVKSEYKFNQALQNISIDKIKQYIPYIQQFDQYNLELIADGIHKIIITFNIMDLNQLFKLQDVVMALIPKQAPLSFIQSVEEIFFQISQQFKT